MGKDGNLPEDASSQKKEDASTQKKKALDGVLSEWSAFGSCSTTCGAGIKKKIRTCTPPTNGGKPCSGPTEEKQACNLGDCPGCLREDDIHYADSVIGGEYVDSEQA